MKKFLFLAIAATAFASCSQDEVMEVAEKQAIQFGESFVGNATRAIDPSHVDTDINEFYVYGTLTGKGTNANRVDLYKGAKVERKGARNGKAFTCNQTEYWTPDATYAFAAVAHAKSVTCTSGLPSSIDFDYTDGTVDLLYTKTLNSVTTDGSATPTGGVNNEKIVNFTFDHLLSKLQFKFLNEALDDAHIFKVKDIQISGLPASGTYTIATNPTWSTKGTTASAVEFGDASNATETTAEAVEILKGTTGITSDKAMLVIPNTNTLTITFVKELYYDVDNDKVADKTELIYSDANLTTEKKYTEISLSNQTFAANGNYMLVVRLTSGGMIEFTVEDLKEWDTEVTVPVNPAPADDNEEVEEGEGGTEE